MKGKTKRKIKRFVARIPLAIIGIVFTSGSITARLLALFPTWVWPTYLVILGLVGIGLAYLYVKLLVPDKYFEKEPIDFKTRDENTIQKAVDGILNTKKAEPSWVHATPKFDEVATICSRLKELRFATISGKPGEGKSIAAYQAAYMFKCDEQYHVYALKTEELENERNKEILDKVLYQLDEGLKGRKKLILIDDAHKIAMDKDLKTILQKEAKERNGKYIWIETELFGEEYEKILDECIRINFESFLDKLQRDFYLSKDSILQNALKDRIEGLSEAIQRAKNRKITDVWWFAFCAGRGEERLKDQVSGLDDPELLVLFLISAYTVMSREAELHTNTVIGNVRKLRFDWLTEQISVRDIIRLLQVRKLVKIWDKSKNDKGYISSLHYNFARALIRVSLLREHLVKELLLSARTLLTDKYDQRVHVGVFRHDIGEYAPGFDRENKEWLVNFVNNLSPRFLQCYPPLFGSIKEVAEDVHKEIMEQLNIDKIAESISGVEATKFQQAAYFLNALEYRRDELIKKLDLTKLAKEANTVEVGQFDQLVHLLDALGDRGDELRENLDLAQLSKRAAEAEVGQLQQVAYLLNALEYRRDELVKDKDFDLANLARKASAAKVEQFEQLAFLLNALRGQRDKLIEELDLNKLAKAATTAEIKEFKQVAELLKSLGQRKNQLSVLLNHDTLVQKADQAGPYDITGVTMLVAELEEEHRNKFIRDVDWNSICLKCPIYVHLLSPLGASLENLWKQAEGSSETAGIEKVAQHLQVHADEIKQEIRKAHPRLYSGVAKFLWNCNQVDPALAKEVATETMGTLAEGFSIKPTEYQGAGRLINALHAIDSDLSATFVKDNMVRGRIQQSINQHDWSEEVEGLKHLIRAFYRSAPELWKRMVSYKWIVVDLSSLDLDSLYRDVNEEENAAITHNSD